ncbi:MAG: DEAD/DEAH box helicase family protein [Flavobacteriaceae bacterium]|nr:DEAD/DEAH box helicase family protein [Flavobacteriaceae bacterium]
MNFKIVSEFEPTGDQPQAIKALVAGLNSEEKYQTLLGATGSGKTFTVANVVYQVQKPTCPPTASKPDGQGKHKGFTERLG